MWTVTYCTFFNIEILLSLFVLLSYENKCYTTEVAISILWLTENK